MLCPCSTMEDFHHTVRNLDSKESVSSILHEWEYARSQANYYLSVMRKIGISPEGKKILEVGSGYGFFLIYGIKVLGWELYGVEPGKGEYSGRFETARQMLSENYIDPERVINSAGESIKFDSNSFDVVISNSVLEHVVDPQKVIQEAYRVLTPGGLLIFNMANYRWIYEGHYEMFWFPFIVSKPVAKKYVRLRGQDPNYIDHLNLLVPWKIKKMVKNISGAKICLPLEYLSTESMLERVKARIGRIEKTQEEKDGSTYISKLLYAIASTESFKWLMGLLAGLAGVHYEIHLVIMKEK